MFNYFFYIFQSLVWAWFFSKYLYSSHPGKSFWSVWIFYLLIIYPIAISLYSHYAFKVILLCILVFLMLCIVYKEEKKTKILGAVLLYQLGVLLMEFLFILFLYSFSSGNGTDFFLNQEAYPIFFSILQCIVLFIVYQALLYCFQEKEALKNKIVFIVACLVLVLQIFCWMSAIFVQSDSLFIFYCFCILILFLGLNIGLFFYLIQLQKKEKLDKTILAIESSYTEMALSSKIWNKEAYSKLRHDYLNFIQSKESSL